MFEQKPPVFVKDETVITAAALNQFRDRLSRLESVKYITPLVQHQIGTATTVSLAQTITEIQFGQLSAKLNGDRNTLVDWVPLSQDKSPGARLADDIYPWTSSTGPVRQCRNLFGYLAGSNTYALFAKFNEYRSEWVPIVIDRFAAPETGLVGLGHGFSSIGVGYGQLVDGSLSNDLIPDESTDYYVKPDVDNDNLTILDTGLYKVEYGANIQYGGGTIGNTADFAMITPGLGIYLNTAAMSPSSYDLKATFVFSQLVIPKTNQASYVPQTSMYGSFQCEFEADDVIDLRANPQGAGGLYNVTNPVINVNFGYLRVSPVGNN